MNMQRAVERRRKSPGRRGSALLLTMFTVAALLTLGTTFIAISIGESKQTRGDKDSELARSVAIYGINWVTSYMALPTAWGTDNSRDGNIGGTEKTYKLRPTDTSNNVVTWLGRTLDYSDVSSSFTDGTLQWRIGLLKTANGTGGQVALPTEGLVGAYDITVERLSGDKAGQAFLKGQPTQYAVTCTGYVFRQGDTIYNTSTTPFTINVNRAVAVRQITMRLRPQNPFDFAIFEANMRSWNIPGFNTQFGLNNRTDNGMGIIDPSQYTAGSAKQQEAQLQLQLLQQMYSQVQLDSVGIPTNYTMKGNFRADGSITPGDPFASVSGTIHVFATNQSEIDTIKFQGKSNSFSKPTNSSGNLYDGTYNKSGDGSLFPNVADTKLYGASRGLPPVADYMTSYVADTTAWPTPNPNDPTSSSQAVPQAPVSKATGWAAQMASANGQPNIGYVKVSTPTTGAIPVNNSTTVGADIEIVDPLSGGASIQQPGFAKVKISFTGSKVTVQKVGAYSGKPVDTTTPPFDRPYDVTEFPKGLLYVDGGNVEIQGTIPGNLTVVAAASSDRPTVATPAKQDSQGNLVPQPGLPVLITPDQQANIPTSIYRSGDDAIFQKDPTDGHILNIPAKDPNTGKLYFPAYDPKKIAEQAGSASAVTSEAPLVREGNVIVTGDLKKPAGGNGALGIVAQNYVLLSDQSADTTHTSLQIDGVLMSMQRSVQYGGFMTAEGSGVNSYFQAMAVNPDSNGVVKGGIARPRRQINNGSFTLNGSIIGQYADVESSKTGVGYSTQTINQDAALRSSAPPMFPNFARDQVRAKITWIVVAVSDSSSLKSGTVANGQ